MDYNRTGLNGSRGLNEVPYGGRPTPHGGGGGGERKGKKVRLAENVTE